MLTNCSEFTVKVLEQSQGFLTALITKKTNSKSVWVRLNHLWIDRYLLKVIKDETRTKLETFAKPKKVKSEQYQWRQLFSRVLPTFHLLFSLCLCLTLSWRRPLSYRNQSTDLPPKSMDWFLYDNGLHHEIGNESGCFSAKNILSNKNWAARNCKSLLFLLPFLINFFKYSNILSSSASANFAACPILGYLCPPNKESDFRRNKMFRLKRYSFSVSNCRSIE